MLAWGPLEQCETPIEVLAILSRVLTGMGSTGPVGGFALAPEVEQVQLGLPFLPLWRSPLDDPYRGRWRYWCPLLGRDGRCTDYAHRPALCRGYEAGSDPLCAMHDGVPRLAEPVITTPPGAAGDALEGPVPPIGDPP